MTEADEPFVVPASLAGERIDRAVALVTGWTRSEVQALVKDGAVLVDGATAAKSHRLEEGNVVEITGAPAVAELPGPEPLPVDVQFVDDDIVVVNKPPGIVVHPGAGHAHGTLVNGLLEQFPEIAGVGDPARPGIVHRLDRDTSGLMIVARSPFAYDVLVAALGARDVERRYFALVWGVPDSPRGVVDAPIGRSQRRRQRMVVREAGREARTEYAIREVFDRVALLECTLETGRTHQIRVHLAAIGHPIVGDELYGGRREGLGIGLERPFLHAHRLGFAHPRSGAPMAFEAPLPAELDDALAGLDPPEAAEQGS